MVGLWFFCLWFGYLLLMLILLLDGWCVGLLCGCVVTCGFGWFVVCGLGLMLIVLGMLALVVYVC